eukprot:scaffold3292_cov120-Cylindrotheca_fusiformis.AAC.4
MVTATTTITNHAVEGEMNGDTDSSFVPSERLVWQKYKTWWWPGIFYESLSEFNRLMTLELDESKDLITKNVLTLHLLETSFASTQKAARGELSHQPDQGYIRFFGRPVSEYHKVQTPDYLHFAHYVSEMSQKYICKPEAFQGHHDLYVDFHRGLDEATDILGKSIHQPSKPEHEKWSYRAKCAWEQQLWGNPPQQLQVQGSPMANTVVAAVSLEDETMFSPRTNNNCSNSTYCQESSPLQSPPPLHEGLSPVQPYCPWADIWAKLAYSGWRRCNGEFISPSGKKFSKQEMQVYAKQHYNWIGERRTTRTASATTPATKATTLTQRGGSKKNFSFGVLWKRHLEPSGWAMLKAKRKGPIDYYYVRPNKSVEHGTENVDYFISPDDVVQYCQNHAEDYPDTSECEPSSPEGGSTLAESEPEEEEDDDESTKVPADTEDEGSIANVCLTPKDQATRPQDPGLPLTNSSTGTTTPEEVRYHWPNLWSRLKKDGWKCIPARNNLDSYWWLPPPQPSQQQQQLPKLNLDLPVKDWVKGKHYFSDTQDIIVHIREMDGCPAKKATKDDEISQKPPATEPQTRRRSENRRQLHEKPSNNAAKAAVRPTSSSKTKAAAASRGQKRKSKTINSNKNKKNKAQAIPFAKDIFVKATANSGSAAAPWTRNPLPVNLHSLVVRAGAKYMGTRYHSPLDDSNESFASPREWIQHVATVGSGANLEALSEEDRPILERLLAYGNVPEKPSAWRTIRAITTEETKAFLAVLGYKELPDGSWKIPSGMFQYLYQETFTSLSLLVNALRGAPALYFDPTANKRRRRGSSETQLLNKYQMLALRLRIAEGLDGETWTSEFEESSDGSDSEQDQRTMDSESGEEEIATEDMLQEQQQTREFELEGDQHQMVEEDFLQEQQQTVESESDYDQEQMFEEDVTDEMEVEDDDRTDSILSEIVKLRDSQVTFQEGWEYLQQLGCKYTSSHYVTPNGNEKFLNIHDLKHHILVQSVSILDFETNPLPKASLKRLHRYLKFTFVKLTYTDAVATALKNMEDPEVIPDLLEKIGFIPKGSLYQHTSSSETYELGDVVNTIRAHEGDLKQIGLEGRRRRRDRGNALSMEEDLTLRLWAAEDATPLLFWDEESHSVEGFKAAEEASVENEAPENNSNDGGSVEESASSSDEKMDDSKDDNIEENASSSGGKVLGDDEVLAGARNCHWDTPSRPEDSAVVESEQSPECLALCKKMDDDSSMQSYSNEFYHGHEGYMTQPNETDT